MGMASQILSVRLVGLPRWVYQYVTDSNCDALRQAKRRRAALKPKPRASYPSGCDCSSET